MDITRETLNGAFTSWQGYFRLGQAQATPKRKMIAMETSSTSKVESYSWLSDMPSVREWVGDRYIHKVGKEGFRLANKDFELTVSVKATDVADDQLGSYGPLFENLGYEGAIYFDRLVFDLMAAGFVEKGYDGKPFYSTSHPIPNASATQSNLTPGTEAPWYLIDASRPLKPFILQVRKESTLSSITDSESESVFLRNEFVYGCDMRGNAGFGLHHLVHASKEALTRESLITARTAMRKIANGSGKKIGINPNVLVVDTDNQAIAEELVLSEKFNGSNNTLYKAFELIVNPY